jgi:dethiobiotin synthetase
VSGDFFVTGTDTGIGKTLLSSLLVAALNRKYWKPIQSGACEGTDRETVMKWAGVAADRTFPESYIFEFPVSPHFAAEREGKSVELSRIRRPASSDALIIEGAGGLLVPLNDEALMLDLIRELRVPVIVAARTTLGTINHTLLTVMAIRHAKVDLHGVVMIGKDHPENRRAIERYGNVPIVGWIPWLETIDRQTLIATFRQHFDTRAFE